jgi:hypothetical protein
MKYFRRAEGGKPVEITQKEFIQGVQNEFMFGDGYYEHTMMLFGHGDKLIGSVHMYWVEW